MITIDLQGKVAIVSGASTGIGRSIALTLAEAGARVVVSYGGDRVGAEETAAQIVAAGGAALVVQADMRSLAAVRGLVEQAVAQWGRLDVMVCNAGVTSWGSFLDYTEEQWQQVIDTNLKGTYFAAQAAAQQMVTQSSGGSIVIIGSVVGARAITHLSAYGTTKAGLAQMASALMLELAPHHIRVNSVVVGPTIVPRNLEDDPDYDRHWGTVVPTGRAARPEEIASTVLFLCSDLASYVNGHALVVDGGWTLAGHTPPLDFLG